MVRLYQWFFEEVNLGQKLILHGIVTGHPKLGEAVTIETSPVLSVDRQGECLVVQTKNTEYVCEMKDRRHSGNPWCFVCHHSELYHSEERGAWEEWFRKYAEKYKDKKIAYSIPERSILLRLGNNRKYYFDSMWVREPGSDCREGEYRLWNKHAGAERKSVFCLAKNGIYTLRYFPFLDRNIAFYPWKTKGFFVYIENCGDRELTVKAEKLVYVIPAEQRMLITASNATPGAKLSSRKILYAGDWFG